MTEISPSPETLSDLPAPTSSNQEIGLLSRPLLATLNLDLEKTIYIAFIILAIVTRFYDLGSRVMSHDESLHTQFSYQFYNGDGFQHTPLMHGPFLFHATAISYWLFGDSDFSARIPVAILGIILIAIPYFLRDWIGRKGALFASFLFLISPYLTYYSRYIRHDIYIIVWSLIVIIVTWHYLRQPQEKYLYWFGAGLALMFATKEVAFIYVAIFGSYLLFRLAIKLPGTAWFRKKLPDLRAAILLLLLSIFLIGGGFIGLKATDQDLIKVKVQPGQTDNTNPTQPDSTQEAFLRWTLLAGVGLLTAGVFLGARELREHLEELPEFDLTILYATLLLPAASPMLIAIAGWNPRDYTLSRCVLESQESLSRFQILIAQFTNGTCRSALFSSGSVRVGLFLVASLVLGAAIGIWWNRRRWIVTAVIFHAIFIVFYTSVFTNPGGWTSGMVGSLGYWLIQHDVARGSQPWFYYLFVTPFYEFLPLIFSLLAWRLWLRKNKLNHIIGHMTTVLLLSLLGYSLAHWYFNRTAAAEAVSQIPGIITAVVILILGAIYWLFIQLPQMRKNEVKPDWSDGAWLGILPFLMLWQMMTWLAYSYAGEKMPWLSTHFVIPMALMAGWYFNEQLRDIAWRDLFSRYSLLLWGVTIMIIVAIFLAVGPLVLGQVQLGNRTAGNLTGTGRFLGSLLVVVLLGYGWQFIFPHVAPKVRRPITILAIFSLLSLLTIRFTYMANFPNADYTNEFLVYAHGAPATKDVVLDQLEELSMRLNGDKSINVAFSADVSWPFTWYLREYPNRVFFGDNPSHNLNDSPIVLVGRNDWEKAAPYLGSNFVETTHTFLWWPMQGYEQLSWNAVFGTDQTPVRRGLGNSDVRAALWNIFFYRDYQKYGEVFGGSYRAGEWPLRHDLRLYIRKDVLATLWDYGLGANAVDLFSNNDPYAEGLIEVAPARVWNESGIGGGGQGELFAPRNIAVGPDGQLYVADSGNNRIQVFDANGQFVTAWGSSGFEPGQFSEPWGIAVNDSHVFVADTWNHRIQKFTLDGDFVGAYGQSGSQADTPEGGLGLFFGPRDILLLENGEFLISDTGNHRLQIMDADGNFLTQIGSFGNLLGQFNEPVGLANAPDGTVIQVDTWNGRIQQFTTDLFAIREWPVQAWQGNSINNKPYAAVDSAGRIYITDPEAFRVLIFSSTGDYLGKFGQFGSDTNSFGLPNGIAIDADDNVYIADSGNNRILQFTPIFGKIPLQFQQEGQEDVPIEELDSNNGINEVDGAPAESESDLNAPTESDELPPEPTPSAEN